MSDVSSENLLHIPKAAVKHRLREAKKAAWIYLEGFDANDLCTIMEAIEETVDTPEDEKGHSLYELSILENLKRMGHRVQDHFYNEWQGTITLMDIFATVAYTRAEDGERALSGQGIGDEVVIAFGNADVAGYGLAVEACIDAWEALHLGRSLEDKEEVEARAQREAEKTEFQRRSRSKGGIKTGAFYDEARARIFEKVDELCKSDFATITHAEKVYKVKFASGEINAEGCADYLWAVHGANLAVGIKKVAEYIREYKKAAKDNPNEKRHAERQARHVELRAKLRKHRILREDKDEKPRLWPSKK